MTSIKPEVKQLINNLPDNVTSDELLYHVYLKTQLLNGLEQIRQGKGIRQEEIEAEIRQWLK
jgi:hypothetical protein